MDITKLKIIIEKYGKEPQVDMCIEVWKSKRNIH